MWNLWSRKKLLSWWLPIGCGGMMVLLIMGWLANEPRPLQPALEASSAAPVAPAGDQDSPPTGEPSARLWARPRQGHPIELDYLPMGVQAIVRVRLAELLQHAEGRKMLRSLGPGLEDKIELTLERWGMPVADIDSLTIGLLPQGTTLPQWMVVCRLHAGSNASLLRQEAASAETGSAPPDTTVFWTPDEAPQLVILGEPSVIESLRQQSMAAPLLRRELEDLHQVTHHTDHVTILANPNFFRDEAQGIFAGRRRRLRDGLDRFWSDQAQAVCYSLQLTPQLAWTELRIIAREDWSPQQLERHVTRQLSGLAHEVTDYLGRIHLDPYWQPLALRFPEMVRFVVHQSRTAIEGKQLTVTTALPVEAIHNLLLASELSLASPLRASTEDPRGTWSSWSRDDVLTHTTSIRIAQKSLEAAAADIVRQVRDELPGLPFAFEVRIRGNELQTEGITRNQQIRDFAHDERPVAAILTALVRQANPVQGIASPADPQQKLVWVEAPDEATIWITTRAAAAANGWELPQVFRQ